MLSHTCGLSDAWLAKLDLKRASKSATLAVAAVCSDRKMVRCCQKVPLGQRSSPGGQLNSGVLPSASSGVVAWARSLHESYPTLRGGCQRIYQARETSTLLYLPWPVSARCQTLYLRDRAISLAALQQRPLHI